MALDPRARAALFLALSLASTVGACLLTTDFKGPSAEWGGQGGGQSTHGVGGHAGMATSTTSGTGGMTTSTISTGGSMGTGGMTTSTTSTGGSMGTGGMTTTSTGAGGMEAGPPPCCPVSTVCVAAGDAGAGRCAPISLKHTNANPGSIALDDTYLYWAESSGTGTIGRVSKAGDIHDGTILASNEAGAANVRVRGHHVYWTSHTGTTITIRRLDLTSLPGTPATVTTVTGTLYGFTVDDAKVYAIVDSGSQYDIWSAPLGTGTTPIKATAPTSDGPRSLTFDPGEAIATKLYWVGHYPPAVHSAPAGSAGAAVKTLIDGGTDPWEIVAAGAKLYWTSGNKSGITDPNAVLVTGFDGGTYQAVSSGEQGATSIAAAQSFIVWGTSGNGDPNQKHIGMAPLDGGPPSILLDKTGWVQVLAAEEGAVYYADDSGAFAKLLTCVCTPE